MNGPDGRGPGSLVLGLRFIDLHLDLSFEEPSVVVAC
jgi:hypothetical protein